MANLFIDKIEDVAEALRSEYTVQADGRFRLNVVGDVPEVTDANDKLREFRDTNIGLMKKVETVAEELKRFEGLDPLEYAKLKTKLADLESAGPKKNADAEDRLTTAVRNAVEPLQKQLSDLQTREADAKKALSIKNVESSLAEVARKSNVRKPAVADFLARGTQVFDLDGKAMDGDRPRYAKAKPAEELTMDEWAVELMQDAPHLFEESKGGGSGSTNTGGGGGSHGKRVVSSDPIEFGRNLEDLASGKAVVQ